MPLFHPSAIMMQSTVPIGTPTSFLNGSASEGSASSTNFTTTSDVTSGNLVVISLGYSTNTNVTPSAVSVGALSLSSVGHVAEGGAINHSAMWYGIAGSTISSGATVTVTWSAAHGGGNIGCQGLQCSGIAASPLDTSATQSSTSATTITATTGTLAQANSLAVGNSSWWQTGSPTYTTPSGFTNLNSQPLISNTRVDQDYKVLASTSAVSYTPGWSVSGRVTAIVGIFKGN